MNRFNDAIGPLSVGAAIGMAGVALIGVWAIDTRLDHDRTFNPPPAPTTTIDYSPPGVIDPEFTCDAEDEVLVELTRDAYVWRAGDQFCVHVDALGSK